MNKFNKYSLYEIGKTEEFISIDLIKILQKIDTKKFIKNYKISNFWKGKFFIKRLINKIFKYKLNQKMIWNPKFWNEINIQIIKSQIYFKKETYNDEFMSQLTSKRKKDILKYKKIMKNNIHMGYPLFITGECLNQIGEKKINENKIFILDGSRRLIASLLNENKEIDILLITFSK